MASCSGRMHATEVQHNFLTQHLPSRRLQRCIRTIYPESVLHYGRQKRDLQVTRAVADVAEVKGKASRMPSLPFVKVADQEDMKLALMLNVIDPTIGGVLIMGERGTGKSVAVRYINTGSQNVCHAMSRIQKLAQRRSFESHRTCGKQVRAMVDLLPQIEVVADDPFNSSPSDPKVMGPEALERFNRGEQLPTARVKTPLASALLQLPATPYWACNWI